MQLLNGAIWTWMWPTRPCNIRPNLNVTTGANCTTAAFEKARSALRRTPTLSQITKMLSYNYNQSSRLMQNYAKYQN